MKRKILFCSEASYSHSGFSKYCREVISRLHNTNKFEIAEFAQYGNCADERARNIPWRFYGNAVNADHPKFQEYMSRPTNQFGEWRFEKVLLDFLPDITVCVRDWWMDEHVFHSPLRPYFHIAWMPTCDSVPLQEDWIENLIDTDAVFAYNDWSLEEMRKATRNKANIQCSAPPGIDPTIFSLCDNKKEQKQKMGFDSDINLIGMVSRNQIRKLFPDLFIAFENFLQLCKERNNEELARKTYLFLHTSYPDGNCWDLPVLLKERAISHKVLFSYVCKKCKKWFPALFSSSKTFCPFCDNLSAFLPNTQHGVEEEQLAEIYKCLDLYVQYATCLPSGEQILTYNGWKNIENIKNGDYVYTHKHNWKPVIQTFKRKAEDIYKITVFGEYEKLHITGNHPIYGHSKSKLCPNYKRGMKEWISKIKKRRKNIPELSFTKCEECQKGDIVAIPINDTISWLNRIDISNFKKDCDTIDRKKGIIKVKHGHVYKSYIDIDEQFCRFIGLFAADGCASNNILRVTSNSKEFENIKLCQNIMYNLTGKFAHIRYTRKNNKFNSIDSTIHSSLYYRVFKNWFYKEKEKRLPEWCMTLPPKLQLEIIHGLCMGDGCYVNYKKGRYTTFNTTSVKLAEQFKVLLRRNRILYSCSKTIRKHPRKPQYNFEMRKCDLKNTIKIEQNRNNTCSLYHNNYLLLSIKSVEKTDKNENVYNIEVKDDNSYITKICSVHNCEGSGMSQQEAASCGTHIMSVNYSAMADTVKKIGGTPLKVKKMFRDIGTKALRAYPDNQYTAECFYKYFTSPEKYKKEKSEQARNGVLQHYVWDKTAKIWENYLENCELVGLQGKWDSPPRIINPKEKDINSMSNYDFITYLNEEILGRLDKKHKKSTLKLLSILNYGAEVNNKLSRTTNREDILKRCIQMMETHNLCEAVRCGMRRLQNEDFLEFANVVRE